MAGSDPSSPARPCLWCRKPTDNTDVSHVLPECFGNDRQQVLTPGSVCRDCNNYFGTKIEPALVADPLIHALCVAKRVVDPGDGNAFRDQMFDSEHPPVEPVRRDLKVHLTVKSDALELDVLHSVRGRIRQPYDRKKVARLSRALHKIAFESFAWHLSQQHINDNLLDARFDHIRRWAREGQPHLRVRPFLRVPHTIQSDGWETRVWAFGEDLAIELRLFEEWFAVSLTSPPESAENCLRKWGIARPGEAWLIGDSYSAVVAPTAPTKKTSL